jgi:hypothetical protein
MVPIDAKFVFGIERPISVRVIALVASIFASLNAEIAMGTLWSFSATDFFCAVTNTS